MTEKEAVDFIDIPDVGGAVEPHAVDSGEYKVRVVGWTGGLNGSGNPFMMPKLAVVEPKVVGSRIITYYIALPHANMDENELNNCNRKLKKFCTAFGLSYPCQINTKEDVGMEAWALIEKREDQSDYADENGYTNNIKRWIR